MGAENAAKPQQAGQSGEKPAAPSKLSAIIAREVEASIRPLVRKMNGEMKDRRIEAKGKGKKSEGEEGDESAAPALTNEDLDAAVEVGELRAKLPRELLDEVAEELEGKSYREKRDALRWLSRGSSRGGQGEEPRGEMPKSRGEMPVSTRTTRGTPPAVRETAPRPRSLQEYRELVKSNPAAAKRLQDDPDFDPESLPYSTPR